MYALHRPIQKLPMFNILYFGRPHADYLNDTFLHGVLSNDSFNLEEYPTSSTRAVNEWWPEARVNTTTSFMFKNSPLANSQIYGGGYTLYKLIDGPLPLVPTVDEVNQKISDNYYDLVVIGSIFNVFPSPSWKNNPNGSMFNTMEILDDIIKQYPKNRIVLLEGEDTLPDNVGFGDLIDKYKKTTTFFMRECSEKYEDVDVHPITFGFPKEKICFNPVQKTHSMCPIIPGKIDSYVMNNETLYYKTLQQSHFALTTAKAGWDCMRHYEIIFNKSFPYFHNIKNCPKNILWNHRKDLYIAFIDLYEKHQNNLIGDDAFYGQCENYSTELFDYALEHHTTEKIVDYVMDVLG